MTFAVILPHTKVFGGVKRFFEIGNELIANQHSFIVFTPEGVAPNWFAYRGEVRCLSELKNYALDLLFITEPEYVPDLTEAKASLKVFYAILQRRSILRAVRRFPFFVFANSHSLYKYLGGASNPRLLHAPGGIDVSRFAYKPRRRNADEPFTVLVYGRFYRKKKGTMLVVKACERLRRAGMNVRLLLFDSPQEDSERKRIALFTTSVPFEFAVDHPSDRLQEIYHRADIFVSAERNAGWSNTSAEAMACGVPVIGTPSGTEDFLIHEETGLVVWRHSWFVQRAIQRLMLDEALRERLRVRAREKIEEFSWNALAGKIMHFAATELSGQDATSSAPGTVV